MKEFWLRLGQNIAGFFYRMLEEHPGKLGGVAAGFVLGIFVVVLGFWQCVLLALCMAVGFFFGKCRDEGRNPFFWLDKFWYKK